MNGMFIRTENGEVHIHRIQRKPTTCTAHAKIVREHVIDWATHEIELAKAEKERCNIIRKARKAARGKA